MAKYWVQFLIHPRMPPTYMQLDTSKLVDAVGDRAVFILDGRNSHETMREDALRQAQKMEHWNKYAAYQLVTGPRFFEESKRSPVYPLTYPIRVG